MDLRSTQLKDTYGNLVTTGTTEGSPTTGGLQNGDGQLLTQVGIGTNSPRGILDLKFTGDGALSTTTSEYQIILEAPSGTGDYARNIGWAETTGVNVVVSAINAVDEGSASATGLTFGTGNSVSFAERMRIGSGGDISFRDTSNNEAFYWDAAAKRIGIGTDSPAEALHVYNPTANVNVLIESGDTQSYLAFKDSSTTSNASVYLGAIGDEMQFVAGGSGAMRIDSSGNVLVGETSISAFSSANTIRVKGGIHTSRGQFVASGSTTTTIVTLASESKNQTYLLSVRQSGSSSNNVMGYVTAFAGSASVIRMAQDNTNPVLDLDFSASGLTLQLVTGSGYGSTTWDWVLTRLG